MKKIFSLLMLLWLVTALHAQQNRTISMGPAYVNQVYFGLASGQTATAPRDAWDLAFISNPFSASIRVNSGAGAQLFIPLAADTGDWETSDTAGMIPVFDSDTSWEESAFNYGHGGHPDYGWGLYAGGGTLIGKRIFFIRLLDGSLKKIWIKRLDSGDTYTIRLANPDNSRDTTFQIRKSDFRGKRFFYYDLRSMRSLDLDPPAEEWDLLFTKYSAQLAPGVFYPVTGVLSSGDIQVAKAGPVDTVTADYRQYDFSANISTIGYDWKSYDPVQFRYEIKDSTLYWLMSSDSSIYRLIFTAFEGASSGNISFKLKKLTTSTGLGEEKNNEAFDFFPNPASGRLYLMMAWKRAPEKVLLHIADMQGRTILTRSFEGLNSGMQRLELSIASLPAGTYLLLLDDGRETISRKLFVRK